MKKIYTRQEPENLEKIRKALHEDGVVEVHNQYETVYGVDFDDWLRKGLSDLDCDFKVTSWCHFEYRYPWTYIITLKR